MSEESWRRKSGESWEAALGRRIIEEELWEDTLGVGIMQEESYEKESRRRIHGRGLLEEES